MRQPQHSKRSRGRGRRSQHPSSRSYESSGPDVKIRGTAAHIAEQYLALSRDAQSSGDEIAAQNYMQHAEHYLRILSAAQAHQNGRPERPEQQPQQPALNGNGTSGRDDARAASDEQADGGEREAGPRRRGRRGTSDGSRPDPGRDAETEEAASAEDGEESGRPVEAG